MSDAASYLKRLIALESERRDNAEDRKELGAEMKSAGLLSKVEIAGIKLAARRHFEDPDKREHRLSVEEFAASLGEMAHTDLGRAAIAEHAAGERVAV